MRWHTKHEKRHPAFVHSTLLIKLKLCCYQAFLQPTCEKSSKMRKKPHDDSYTIFTSSYSSVTNSLFTFMEERICRPVFVAATLNIQTLSLLFPFFSSPPPFLYRYNTHGRFSSLSFPTLFIVKVEGWCNLWLLLPVSKAIQNAWVLSLLNQTTVCSLAPFSWSGLPTKTSQALLKSKICICIFSHIQVSKELWNWYIFIQTHIYSIYAVTTESIQKLPFCSLICTQ